MRCIYNFHLSTLTLGWFVLTGAFGYKVEISDADDARQICSGMWSGMNTYINVSFSPESRGQVAAVIYEWADVDHLGKPNESQGSDDFPQKVYVCTSDAVRNGYCSNVDLGKFILDFPPGVQQNETSMWTARIGFDPQLQQGKASGVASGFWDNPEGNPVLPDDPNNKYTSPFLRRQNDDSGILHYHDPISYPVHTTGYYCVAVIPVTILTSRGELRDPDPAAFHSSFSGTVLFQNTFKGQLAATDYPKIRLYLTLLMIYIGVGCMWGYVCYKHRHELLPIQHYLSSLVGFLIVEMLASWAYYRYLNSHGHGAVSTVFLFVVAILDAGRNSLSLFLLLIVSLGLSVVRESLGPLMTRCWMLSIAHFIFGVLYAVGIVELELESTSALVLLLFIVPLAFTLSGFLSWIMYALNGTIAQLKARKQFYKLGMFQRLYYTLLATVALIGVFFVVSSMSFSSRLQQTMSDELAQDEDAAAAYDLEGLAPGGHDDDDDMTLVGDRHQPLPSDEVVFEIGEEDIQEAESDEEQPSKSMLGRQSLVGESRKQQESSSIRPDR